MTLLPEQGKNPIPRGNFRNGKRTPQMGVEIERKWARADYHVPGTSGWRISWCRLSRLRFRLGVLETGE